MSPSKPLLVLALLLGILPGRAEDTIGQLTERAASDYVARLESATTDLNDTRQRLLRERQPLADATRRLEDKLTALEAEIAQLNLLNAQKTERRQQLNREAAALRKNLSYITTLAQDSAKALNDSLLPGEAASTGDQVQTLQQGIETESRALQVTAAVDTVEFLLDRTRRQLGGYTVAGQALVGDDNRLRPGTFAFVGPEAFFKPSAGLAGTVRTREGSGVAVAYPLENWNRARQDAFFRGELGTIAADPSGGKALRLREVNGTLLQHIERGGVVAYAILLVGLVALAIIAQKFFDLRRFTLDSSPAVERVLAAVRQNARAEMEVAVAALKPTTRELFETGLRHIAQPKQILEEHLFARTLQIRLHYERRLPLLAVIATAAPLMGLLGTVMGMVKTFALITVFGTGNAGKLSGGISEVLVATELGLMVAIPSLVVHGFLAHRIQKNLSLLDRYAIEFVTATEEMKAGVASDDLVAR